jgi:hypothetical protein
MLAAANHLPCLLGVSHLYSAMCWWSHYLALRGVCVRSRAPFPPGYLSLPRARAAPAGQSESPRCSCGAITWRHVGCLRCDLCVRARIRRVFVCARARIFCDMGAGWSCPPSVPMESPFTPLPCMIVCVLPYSFAAWLPSPPGPPTPAAASRLGSPRRSVRSPRGLVTLRCVG